MFTSADWQQDFFSSIQNLGIDYRVEKINSNHVICTPLVNIVLWELGFVATNTDFKSLNPQVQIIHLWQDIWLSRKHQVLSRIQSIFGLNERVHGRKTRLEWITQKQADDFLSQNHLQASARAKYKCALLLGDELVAVATFNMRPMNIREGYQSAELIRFATKNGFSVVGGLSKLLQFFIKKYQPNDVMTYVDNDWSVGNSFLKLGFKYVSHKDLALLWVNTNTYQRYFLHRIPKTIKQQFEQQKDLDFEHFLMQNNFQKVFNTGSSKYILYL